MRLIVKFNGVDVSNDCKLSEGKSNPFGWSQYRLVHVRREGLVDVEVAFGWLESGYPSDLEPGYTAEIVDE